MLVLELLGDSMERVCHRLKGLKNRAAVAIEVIFDCFLTPRFLLLCLVHQIWEGFKGEICDLGSQ